MADSLSLSGVVSRRSAETTLTTAAKTWFLVTLAGQWIFVVYIFAYFILSMLGGGLEVLADTHLPNGFVAGETVGNLAVAAHLMLALIIIGTGPLQLVPQVRARFPFFHRWNGRLYIAACFLTSMVGLFMVWTRGTVGDLVQHIGISGDAVLILVFGALALRYAMAGDIRAHRRWALRLFMVASAVWFYRIGLMGWIFANGGPAGFDPKTFTGPFLNFLTFGQYLVPLFILELYFYARDRAGAAGKYAMASGLFVVSILMAFGIFAATMGMWLPRI